MSKRVILLVDDDEIYHDIILQILEPYHYEVIHAYDGKEAIEKFKQNSKIDLILSDIMMPKVGGIELLEHIRSSNRADTPMIMMTSHVKNEFILQALRLGASDFIGKKFDEVSLLNSINRQLNKITKQKKDSFTTFHLKKSSFEFSLKPENFIENQLSFLILSQIQSLNKISNKVFNELLIVLDELLSNAFIHGVFELSEDERYVTKDKHINLINSLLEDERIRNMKVKVFCTILPEEIEIAVVDQGKGFEYQSINFGDKELLSFDPFGRGLNLVFLMTDEINFQENGSKVVVKKRLNIGK